MTVTVNDTDFEEQVISSDVPVLVDFWADWCMPCKMIAPVLDEISREYSGRLKVCKLNVDESSQTAAKYRIMSIPTLALFKNGEVATTIVGAVSRKVIDEKLQENL